MMIRLRQIARQDPDVFHFIRSWMRVRAELTGWSCMRELAEIWYHEHADEL